MSSENKGFIDREAFFVLYPRRSKHVTYAQADLVADPIEDGAFRASYFALE